MGLIWMNASANRFHDFQNPSQIHGTDPALILGLLGLCLTTLAEGYIFFFWRILRVHPPFTRRTLLSSLRVQLE